jgi:hypothetical protein
MKKTLFSVALLAATFLLQTSTALAVQGYTYTGDTAQFDAIMGSLEDKLEANYYTLEHAPVHSRDFAWDSTQTLLWSSVYDGMLRPLWEMERGGDSVFIRASNKLNYCKDSTYVWWAQTLYRASPPTSAFEGAEDRAGELICQAELEFHVSANRFKRRDTLKAGDFRRFYSLTQLNIEDKAQHVHFAVGDTVYNGIICYLLKADTHIHDSRYSASSHTRWVINKNDYAILCFDNQIASEGKRSAHSHATYEKQNGKYRLLQHELLLTVLRSEDKGLPPYTHYSTTWQMKNAPSITSGYIVGGKHKPTEVSKPTPQMLAEWKNFTSEK